MKLLRASGSLCSVCTYNAALGRGPLPSLARVRIPISKDAGRLLRLGRGVEKNRGHTRTLQLPPAAQYVRNGGLSDASIIGGPCISCGQKIHEMWCASMSISRPIARTTLIHSFFWVRLQGEGSNFDPVHWRFESPFLFDRVLSMFASCSLQNDDAKLQCPGCSLS